MLKPALLYYDVLNYHKRALDSLYSNFSVCTLPDPSRDADELLGTIDVLMAPLGFPVDQKKIDRCSISQRHFFYRFFSTQE